MLKTAEKFQWLRRFCGFAVSMPSAFLAALFLGFLLRRGAPRQYIKVQRVDVESLRACSRCIHVVVARNDSTLYLPSHRKYHNIVVNATIKPIDLSTGVLAYRQ